MRAAIFRKLIHLLKQDAESTFGRLIRKLFSRMALQILLFTTAKGFAQPGKWILFSKDALKAYADFTLSCMEKPSNQEAIYHAAYGLGSILRKISGFSRAEDLTELVFFLYKNIRITMTGSLPGEIRVSSCYFAEVYHPRNCAYVSAMDHGVIAGLFQGGELSFSQRITEGQACCVACLKMNDKETRKDEQDE